MDCLPYHKNNDSEKRQVIFAMSKMFEEIEEEVYEWIRGQRVKKRLVNLIMIQNKFKALVSSRKLDLKCSRTFLRLFMKHYDLSYRTPTHVVQYNLHYTTRRCNHALEYLYQFNQINGKYELDCIVNMDETPM